MATPARTTIAANKKRMKNMRDPIDILTKEHEAGMAHLEQLRRAAEIMKTEGFGYDAFNKIDESVQFIDSEIRRHNEKEEGYLFPLLELHVKGSSEIMRSDSIDLWKAINCLRECIKDIKELRISPGTVRELINYCSSIVELLSNHFTKENNVLFPMTKALLSPDEYNQLKNDLAKAAPAVSP